MIAFEWENWPEISGEALPMLRAYWNDGGQIFGKELPMDPDFETVMLLHKMGRLKILTARRDGFLVGLNGFNCGGTIWRKRTPTAVGLILYLLPSERRGMIGWKFLKETETGLAKMGIKLIVYIPSSSVDLSKLLFRLGYKKLGGSFEKMVGNQ